MANFSTNEFRAGLKVMLDGDPCSIMDNELVKPGKGQAFNRVRLRNLKLIILSYNSLLTMISFLLLEYQRALIFGEVKVLFQIKVYLS